MSSMAGMKLKTFFQFAFPAGFPAQLPPRSRAEHPGQGKTKKDFSRFSLGLLPPLPNTSFQGENKQKKKRRGKE